MARYARKKYGVVDFCLRQTKPFTIDDIHRAMRVSPSTVYRALRSSLMDNYFVSQPRGKHFFMVIFPPEWNRADVKLWCDNRCKSGKSKAKIHKLGKSLSRR